eukprot:scaffold261681_cov35-Tisochrysis_lutea.AAC.2
MESMVAMDEAVAMLPKHVAIGCISKNWIDLVQPERAATEAVPGPGLMPHNALRSDDLPVLERPVNAISGSTIANGSSYALGEAGALLSPSGQLARSRLLCNGSG